MYSQFALVVLVAVFSTSVASKTSFITPPPPGPGGNYQDNPTHKEGRQLEFKWTSNVLKLMNLGLWQEYPTPGDGTAYYLSLLENTTAMSLNWTVSLARFSKNVAKGEAAIFYLALYDSETNTREATCHYFNVTVNSASSTSVTSSPPITSTSAVSTSSTTMTVTSTGTSTPTMEADTRSSGLSTGATAGVAVGATLGGLLVLGGLGFLAWRCLRREKSSANPVVVEPALPEHKSELPADPYQSYGQEQRHHTQDYGPQPIHEAP